GLLAAYPPSTQTTPYTSGKEFKRLSNFHTPCASYDQPAFAQPSSFIIHLRTCEQALPYCCPRNALTSTHKLPVEARAL
ncbi:MAG: hypothetical protein WCY84_02675, partial [Candidatus Cloacimonadaceae bacterium]